MQPLRLDDVTSLPGDFVTRLQAVNAAFKKHEHIESVISDTRVWPLAAELEERLRQLPVRAYHCTREPAPGHFAREGLRLTDVEAHQQEFLRTFGHRFTPSELHEMKVAWQRYFEGTGQTRGRNGRIWFCLTAATTRSDGTDVFFKHFGGEAIFMPLKQHPTIAMKLGSIGMPVVVEVRLPPGTPSTIYSLARPLLSAYHLTQNPDAIPWLAETFIQQAIPVKDVLRVSPM